MDEFKVRLIPCWFNYVIVNQGVRSNSFYMPHCYKLILSYQNTIYVHKRISSQILVTTCFPSLVVLAPSNSKLVHSPALLNCFHTSACVKPGKPAEARADQQTRKPEKPESDLGS